jgi:hypothetical protein
VKQNEQQGKEVKERHLKLVPPLPKKEPPKPKPRWNSWHWASVAVLLVLLVSGYIWQGETPGLPEQTGWNDEFSTQSATQLDQLMNILNRSKEASMQKDWILIEAVYTDLETNWQTVKAAINESIDLANWGLDIYYFEEELSRLKEAITHENSGQAEEAIENLITMINNIE